ncbi:MAG: peroxiredoxin [Candidatus Thiodiazotropha sp.]|nr:peroxiredoxin [Candidatus Thiodiazotropha sp.]MCM8885479.1 peroxiredoxin [Candidatus Thiodiazotropha sp.]
MSSQLSIIRAVSGIIPLGQVTSHIVLGEPAPDFHLIDQHGKVHQLTEYKGGWLVLYFYPRDNTPGCTTEACIFRDNQHRFNEVEVVVLGVSTNSLSSHQTFSQKYQLPFPLLSDVSGKVAKAYGSLFQLGPLKFAKRHSFIIDPEGNIAAIFREVDIKNHNDRIFEALQSLDCSKEK